MHSGAVSIMSNTSTFQNATVLVTGAAGFIGAHCIQRLAFHNDVKKIVGTVRSLTSASGKKDQIVLEKLTSEKCNLKLVELDLVSSPIEEWTAVLESEKVDFVLHVASPYFVLPESATLEEVENKMLIPAQEGTRKVMQAAVNCNVKRVVVTSSIAAAMPLFREETAGMKQFVDSNKELTTEYWTDCEIAREKKLWYPLSKVLAEKEAWKYHKGDDESDESDVPEGKKTEVVTILPGGVFGPILVPGKRSENCEQISMVKGAPVVPPLGLWAVHVEDVAEMHIKALETQDAKGKRFFAVERPITVVQFAGIVKRTVITLDHDNSKSCSSGTSSSSSSSTIVTEKTVNDVKDDTLSLYQPYSIPHWLFYHVIGWVRPSMLTFYKWEELKMSEKSSAGTVPLIARKEMKSGSRGIAEMTESMVKMNMFEKRA